MSYPILPTDKIPYPVRDNYQRQYQQKQRRKQMDDGQSRVRRIYESQPVAHTLTWVLTWQQYANFEAFLRYDCSQGAGFFQAALAPGQSLQTIRFTQYPKASYDPNRNAWMFQGPIETIQQAGSRVSDFTTLPVWPDTLPEPEKNGYGANRDDEFVRDNPDDGLANQRARFTESIATYSVTWLLSPDQLQILDNFVHNELFDGLAFFKGPFVNGLGQTKSRCRFASLPVATPQGAWFEVKATLETTEIPFIPYFQWEDLGNVQLSDSVTTSDIVGIKFVRSPLIESVTTTESIRIFVNRRLFESVATADAVSTVSDEFRTTAESVATSDMVNYNLRLGAKAESVTTTGTGSVAWNDYCDGDYCNDDYVGTTSTF